jgi:hypothetical protein
MPEVGVPVAEFTGELEAVRVGQSDIQDPRRPAEWTRRGAGASAASPHSPTTVMSASMLTSLISPYLVSVWPSITTTLIELCMACPRRTLLWPPAGDEQMSLTEPMIGSHLLPVTEFEVGVFRRDGLSIW